MRIGLVVQNLDEEYQIQVFRGVRARARAQGCDLMVLQGAWDAPPWDDLDLGGLLVLSSVLPGPMRLPPGLPAVSVGLAQPGMASIEVRSGHSLERLVRHLVVDHGYRSLLYVGGPADHPDNRAREAAFLATVARWAESSPGLTARVDHGGFYETSGMAVIRRYTDGPAFDAVVAANDNMAIGIRRVLEAHPDPAWRACAVTGYDDVPRALALDPPLTTVHTPIRQMGARAVDLLLQLAAGETPAPVWTVASRVVIRGSCGCRFEAASPEPQPSLRALEAARRQMRASDQWLREGIEYGRELAQSVDRATLADPLDRLLGALGVDTFWCGVGGEAWFQRRGGQTLPVGPERPGSLGRALEPVLGSLRHPWVLCLGPLRSGETTGGLVAYATDDARLPHLTAALPHLAHAVRRVLTAESEAAQRRLLEELVAERTANLTEANAALRAEVTLRRAAEEEVLHVSEYERQRFGLDLHDDICQRLAGAAMFVHGALRRPPAAMDAFLGELATLLDQTLTLTRQYAHASFPMELEERGIDEVLATLCDTAGRTKGLPCVYSREPEAVRAVPRGLPSLHLFRIVQEAVQNALRHSQAHRIDVRLRSTDAGWVLEVEDDGVGMPGRPEELRGFGLRSIAYRAGQLGAEVDWARGSAGGVRLRVKKKATSPSPP